MTITAKPGRMTGLLLAGLLLLTAMFLGLLIGAEQHVLLVLFTLLVLTLPMLYLAIFGFADLRAFLLGAGFGLMFVAQLLQSHGIPIGYLMEAMIFLFMLTSLRQAAALARRDSALRWVIGLFVLYLALALLSTALGRSHLRGALWQLQYNLKLPLMFALGLLLVAPGQALAVLRRFVAWSWLFFLPFLVFELAAPSLFIKLLGYTADVHVNPLLGFAGRLRGPFSHSGYMALMCALLAASAAALWLQQGGRRWLGCAAIYTLMAISTGQRQELLSLLIVFGLFLSIAGRRHLGWLAAAAVFGLALALVLALFLDHNPLAELQRQWAGRASDLSERAVLTQQGLYVANQYFPLGSGLGTYGGAGAQKFDQSLFIDLGFSRYWWFRQGIFLVDTYWPSVAAETGYPAAVLLLASYAVLWCGLYRRAVRAEGDARVMLLVAVAALTLLLANSPTSAVITDPRGAFVFWLVIGCAWRAAVQQVVVNRATAVPSNGHNRPVDLSYSFRSLRVKP